MSTVLPPPPAKAGEVTPSAPERIDVSQIPIAPVLPGQRGTTPVQDLTRGVWRENPIFSQMLGLCATLAVTNTVANSIAMGLATFFVLLGSSILISSMRKLIPHEVRISAYILIIATFVTIVDLVLNALFPDIHKALGAFIALIVVNCIILGRQEAFASKRPVGRAALDAIGTGLGFCIALLAMGSIREVLGYGSFLGVPLFGDGYEPWIIMILPPGGFFTLGSIMLVFGWWAGRSLPRPAVRRWPHGVAEEVH